MGDLQKNYRTKVEFKKYIKVVDSVLKSVL